MVQQQITESVSPERKVPDLPKSLLSGEPTLGEIVADLQGLRQWCGQIFMLVRDIATYERDAVGNGQLATRRAGEVEKAYVELSNKVKDQGEILDIISESILGVQEDIHGSE